jgi:hypothetical protein
MEPYRPAGNGLDATINPTCPLSTILISVVVTFYRKEEV